MKKPLNEKLFYENSRIMRIDCLKMGVKAGLSGAHYGGSFSVIEIMNYLYNHGTNINEDNIAKQCKDRVILSKGHGAMALYAAYKQIGILSDDDLLTFKLDKTNLYAHPSMNKELGIDFSSGSLGQGLSLGVGVAISLLRKEMPEVKVYVILGDGECNEGQIWEAAMLASQLKLNNLIVIVDYNHIQYDDFTANIINLEPFEKRWESFGWNAKRIDGHDFHEINAAFSLKSVKPYVIIADTIKGKGISFMENNHFWHHGILNKEQEIEAYNELGKKYE